jgi:ATPase subunit of ABC transporter with duplicated ATPase domains
MPIFQIHSVSFNSAQGEPLLHNLSWSLNTRRSALVGRNGIGKSVLINIIKGSLSPTQGSVTCHKNIGYFDQQHDEATPHLTRSVADYLGLSTPLLALDAIKNGSCDPNDFAAVGDNWLLEQQLKAQLLALNIPTDYWQNCSTLSGGQLTCLKLWRLFSADYSALILDEPSNHLDLQAKQWLNEQIADFNGPILVVSHDPELLKHIPHIYELTPHGLTTFSGNYDDFIAAKNRTTQALEKQISHVKKQQRKHQLAAQKNQEKAQQRAAKGKTLRKQGSQAKVLLDAKKDQASANSKRQKINVQQQHDKLSHIANTLMAKQIKPDNTHFSLQTQTTRNNKVIVRAHQLTLPHGTNATIDLVICEGEKWHISGRNGTGKTTLFNILRRKVDAISGTFQLNSAVFCLDQHYQLLRLNRSIFNNLSDYCPTLSTSDARTLLAGVGFKAEQINITADKISGGQKMKLAMLIVSHQPNRPILLLDEPDNHLDTASKQHLAKALCQFNGTVLLISHDPTFVEQVGIDHTLNL